MTKWAALLGVVLGVCGMGWWLAAQADGHDDDATRAALRAVMAHAAAPMQDDGCYLESEPSEGGWQVADFLADMTLFGTVSGQPLALRHACGERGEDVCGLSYGVAGVEGGMGQSWTLFYTRRGESGGIDPESFSCFGQ
ncbi:hypothetical protein [Vannielia sp. SX4]|uniref:hypothetical protein n=1 Tax=Vannielia sp. SX4 TaxID=3463852 RepID=UPI004058BF04